MCRIQEVTYYNAKKIYELLIDADFSNGLSKAVKKYKDSEFTEAEEVTDMKITYAILNELVSIAEQHNDGTERCLNVVTSLRELTKQARFAQYEDFRYEVTNIISANFNTYSDADMENKQYRGIMSKLETV